MSCPFAHDDAAYVLGALSPVERLDFERHLVGCDECTRAVGELAGVPGLLGRVDPSVLEPSTADEPLPDTLLPTLSRAVRRTRSRRTRAAIGLAAAAVAALVALLAWQIGGAAPPDDTGDDTGSPELVALAMDPVGEAPLEASLTLEQVTWGTRLGLTCTYDRDSVEYALPAEVDYTLVVRTRDGRVERVGSWRSVSGMTMRLMAATASTSADIDSVEVRTPDGRVVLRLTV